MSKRGRKPIRVTKLKYAQEYWNKHSNKLKEVFKYGGEREFMSIVKHDIKQDSYYSKRSARESMEKIVYERTHTVEESELRKARMEASNRPLDSAGNEIKDMRQLNGKFQDEEVLQTPLTYLDLDINGKHYKEEITSYYEIKGNDYVLAKIEGSTNGQSPYTIYKYVRREDVGL